MVDLPTWGPKAWCFLHAVTFSYPDNPSMMERQGIIDFFNSMPYVLPCSKCRAHFGEMLKARPVEANSENRDQLAQWLVDIHNEVNRSTGKPPVAFSDVACFYSESAALERLRTRQQRQAWKRAKSFNRLCFWSLVILALCFCFLGGLLLSRQRASALGANMSNRYAK